MRYDQRRQLFLSYVGTRGNEDEEELFGCTSKLLMKDVGIRWNSAYYMLRRAMELKNAIERFQRSQTPCSAAERESGYSFRVKTESIPEIGTWFSGTSYSYVLLRF